MTTTPTATVCAIFEFAAAVSYANPRYDGPGSHRLHGHTWTVEIYARGPISDDPTRRGYGMALMIESLDEAYRSGVAPTVEHQNLDETLADLPERTTELIAHWILRQLRERQPLVFRIRLWPGRSRFVEVEA